MGYLSTRRAPAGHSTRRVRTRASRREDRAHASGSLAHASVGLGALGWLPRGAGLVPTGLLGAGGLVPRGWLPVSLGARGLALPTTLRHPYWPTYCHPTDLPGIPTGIASHPYGVLPPPYIGGAVASTLALGAALASLPTCGTVSILGLTPAFNRSLMASSLGNTGGARTDT